MIPAIFQKPRWRTIVLTKSSCPMVDHDMYYSRIGKIYQVCTDWRNAVLDKLETIKPDVIIMGNAATYGFTEIEWLEGSARVFAKLNQTQATIFVIPGTPNLGFDGPGCVSRHISPEGRINRKNCLAEDRLKLIDRNVGYLENAVNRFPNIHLLNLNDLVCPEDKCNAIAMNGVIVFRDNQHLTDSFVRSQVPIIRDRMMQYLDEKELSDSNLHIPEQSGH